MPLWPFGRKKRRTSTSSQAVTVESESTSEKRRVAEPRRDDMAQPLSKRNSQRKRKAASDRDRATSATHEKGVEQQQPPPPRNTSVQDITALPDLRDGDSSPHLRPVQATNTAIVSHSLDRSSPGRAGVSSAAPDKRTSSSPVLHSHQSMRTSLNPQRRRSGRRRDESLREEEIRAMSSPIQISKRPAGGNNELLRRDSKKARRTFSSKQRPDDQRGSNVSLPISIPSSMSALPEQRGWQVGLIDVFSPRPTVRLSAPGFFPPNASAVGLSRKGSKKAKLPAIAQGTSTKDRRKVADLADDLDSSDLRAVLERDARRREQKALEQQQRLDRKLQRRAEKQRIEQEREEAAATTAERALPTSIHPAFREQGPDADLLTGLLTPQLTHDDTMQSAAGDDSPTRGGTYLKYPPREDIPQNPFEDPVTTPSPFSDPQLEPISPAADHWSPVETPMEEPVLETARAVRLSQGRLSPPVSPTTHPRADDSLSELSDLQAQRTTSVTRPIAYNQRRASETSSRRAGTWASIFRRGQNTSRTSLDYTGVKPAASEGSFSNVSRESMSRQAIPAHLIQQSSRRSGTPVRTQSRFREDLPDAPMSPPDSRVQSPDLPNPTAGSVVTRRSRRATQQSDVMSPTSEPAHLGRTDSPVVTEEDDSEVPISQSLGSIDSEGSWISGRPVRLRSNKRLQRDSATSAASMDKQIDGFSGSYERLPIPEHEYFSALTPRIGSRQVSNETAPLSTGMNTTPTAADAIDSTADEPPLIHGAASRRPTVVHNQPRFKSREGLVAEYMAGSAIASSSRASSSSNESLENSLVESPAVQNARSVNYGLGHAKSLSAGSARIFDIPQNKAESKRTSLPPTPSPLTQTGFH